jgi:hypothetical protein
MVPEPALQEFARVLHEDDPGPEIGRVFGYPRDEGIAGVVVDVIVCRHPREAGAGRAGDQDVDPRRYSHHLAQLSGDYGAQVSRDGRDAKIRGIGRVAVDGAVPRTGLPDLCVGCADNPEFPVRVKSVTRAAGSGKQINY